MRLRIAAMGRIGPGPEHAMIETYRNRADAAGRAIALGPLVIDEIDERKAKTQAAQADALRARVAKGGVTVVLDERGRPLSSPDFANLLADWRDQGRAEAAFLIGGADGHAPDLRREADLLLGFGPMVWPHMLARVMLTEQIWRAISILTNSPYHRD
ncbi:MAG: 23S rRNA (pseudouridine(1915)-N(3))-methyltransferase RlmH [Pseudomonadota bacterium]